MEVTIRRRPPHDLQRPLRRDVYSAASVGSYRLRALDPDQNCMVIKAYIRS